MVGQVMKFGISLVVRGAAAQAETFARMGDHAEMQHWDCLWASDHLIVPPLKTTRFPGSEDGQIPAAWRQGYYQPFSVLNYLAAHTERVRLGTSVLILPMRNPIEVAAQVAELDQLSHGRVNFGVGVGWYREEFEALGHDFCDRGQRTDDGLRIIQALWSRTRTTVTGPYYHLEDVEMAPKPCQAPYPPIYIGGNSRLALARVARYGDVWHPFRMTPEEVNAARPHLQAALKKAGRAVADFPIALKIPLVFQDGPPAAGQFPSVGRAMDIVAGLQRYAEAGVSEFCFDLAAETLPVALDTMTRFSEEVRTRL